MLAPALTGPGLNACRRHHFGRATSYFEATLLVARRFALALFMVIPIPFFAVPSIVASDHSLLPFTAAMTRAWWPVLVPVGYIASASVVALMPATRKWRALGLAMYVISYLGYWFASLATGDRNANGPSGPSLLLLAVMCEVIPPLLAMLVMIGTLVDLPPSAPAIKRSANR